jgi:peptide/nickel transport system substrate-binding protein
VTIRLTWTLLVALAAVIAVAVGAGSAGAGARSSRSGAIPLLRVGEVTSTVSTLDEFHALGTEYGLSLEKLMKLGSKNQLVPNLALGFTHPNPTTYVYHLRHGVRFWDGNELTAVDAANSWNYFRSPLASTGFYFTSVAKVVAIGRYTMRVTLKRPDAGFPYTASSYASPIFEKKFWDAHKATYGQPGTLIMGTGPWIPVSFQPTSGIEFKANPHYWGGAVPIQHISVKFFADENSEALAMRAGEIDIAPSVQSPASFAATSTIKPISTPSCTIYYFVMPTQMAPWNDVHVRRAVAYALDRQALITAYGGYATAITTLVPPLSLQSVASQKQIAALLKSLPQYPFSIDKAKAELAKSAYPNGFSATIDTITEYGYAQNDEAVAGELAKIGIKLTLNTVSTGIYFNELFGTGPVDKRPPAWTGWGCQNPDASQQSGLLGSKNAVPNLYNEADYTPPVVDKLLADAISTDDPAKRFVAYGNLLHQLALDVPYVPLFVSDLSYAITSKFVWQDFNPFFPSDGVWALHIRAR